MSWSESPHELEVSSSSNGGASKMTCLWLSPWKKTSRRIASRNTTQRAHSGGGEFCGPEAWHLYRTPWLTSGVHNKYVQILAHMGASFFQGSV